MENIEYAAAAGTGGIFLIILRTFVSTPVHALCASLTAIQLIHNDYKQPLPLWKILGPAVFVHGTFDFAAFTLADKSFGVVGGLLTLVSAVRQSPIFVHEIACDET